MFSVDVASYLLAGFFATNLMDLGSLVGDRLGLFPRMRPAIFGRWVMESLRGRVFHQDIRQVQSKAIEWPVGFFAHYFIGVVLALFTGLILGFPSTIGGLAALVVAASTTALPWFFMFPAMGFGCCGLRGPIGRKRLVSSLVAHFNYGLGLYLTLLGLTQYDLLS